MLFILFAIKRHLNKHFYRRIDAWDTCRWYAMPAEIASNIEKSLDSSAEIRDSWSFRNAPAALSAPLKSYLQLFWGVHRSPFECDPVNYYLTYSLSMNERLDNVLARICNWNPRDREREREEGEREIRVALSRPEIGMRWMWTMKCVSKRKKERQKTLAAAKY